MPHIDLEYKKELEDILGWSPTDITPYAIIPSLESSPIKLEDVTQASQSMHRERFLVTSLGPTQAKGFTHGPITAAGSLTLQEFNVLPLYEVRNRVRVLQGLSTVPSIDDLPPITLVYVFTNQAGDAAYMTAEHVVFMDVGYSTGTDQGISYITLGWVGRTCTISKDLGRTNPLKTVPNATITQTSIPKPQINMKEEDKRAVSG